MNLKPYYKYIAIIVAYRNMNDLEDCITSMLDKIRSLRVVIVNNYFDEETKRLAEQIAERFQCDFINAENKGYGSGNNKGISWALKEYTFDYIIISNPDIVIKEFVDSDSKYDVIAPQIITASGKSQNPMVVIRNRISDRLGYLGFKRNKRNLLYISIGLNKIIREVTLHFFMRGKEAFPIYQPHGSFVLISKIVIDMIHPIYDEKMFLFAEEGVLAIKLNENRFQPYYYTKIKVFHKEDGSMKLAGKMIDGVIRETNIYFYEHYLSKKHKG